VGEVRGPKCECRIVCARWREGGRGFECDIWIVSEVWTSE